MPSRAESFARFERAFREADFVYSPERVVLVVGTNGKGSVSKGLEALLRGTGASVGLFTSPHLIDTTERVRSHGRDLTREEFVRVFRAVEPLVVKHRLSHFETLTLMAGFVFFSGQARPIVDWAIFEVGVGGLWDPTNAFDHATTIVTRLGADHQALLGGDLASIARHKLGAVRANGRVVHAPFPAPVEELARHARLTLAGDWVESRALPYRCDTSGPEPRHILQTPWGEIETDLPGPRAAENLSLALDAFTALGFSPREHYRSLSRIDWPGRMETFRLDDVPCSVHLSGDHNVQGVESLLALLPYYRRETLHWLIGIGARKERDLMLERLMSVPGAELNLTRVPFRGTGLSDYGPWLSRAVDVDEDPLTCLRKIARRACARDRIVVSGSLYLVGAVRAQLVTGRLG